jgi:hypothetical protein
VSFSSAMLGRRRSRSSACVARAPLLDGRGCRQGLDAMRRSEFGIKLI